MSGPAGQVGEAPTGRVVEFAVAGMTCAACSARLEKVLNRQPGMQATVNLASERARVRLAGSADEAAVIAAVGKAGFSASVVDAETRTREKARRAAEYRDELRRFWIAVVLTLPLVAQMPFGHPTEPPKPIVKVPIEERVKVLQ